MSHAWRGANRWPLQEWQMRPFKAEGVHLPLTKRQREALDLSRSGVSIPEIATRMGVQRDRVRRLLDEAKARIRTYT